MLYISVIDSIISVLKPIHILQCLFICFYPQMVYRADGNKEKTKCTTTVDGLDIKRAKWAQSLTNKVNHF